MKKFRLLKVVLVLVIFACAGPFLLRDKEGKPFLTLDKIKWPEFSFIPDMPVKKVEPKKVETELLSPDSIVPESGQPVVKIYKFRDEKGVLHFSDKKPNRKDYEVMYMPVSEEEKKGGLDKIKEKVAEFKKKAGQAVSGNKDTTKKADQPSSMNPYSDPGKVIQDAQEVRAQVEETYKQREQMMDDVDR